MHCIKNTIVKHQWELSSHLLIMHTCMYVYRGEYYLQVRRWHSSMEMTCMYPSLSFLSHWWPHPGVIASETCQTAIYTPENQLKVHFRTYNWALLDRTKIAQPINLSVVTIIYSVLVCSFGHEFKSCLDLQNLPAWILYEMLAWSNQHAW